MTEIGDLIVRGQESSHRADDYRLPENRFYLDVAVLTPQIGSHTQRNDHDPNWQLLVRSLSISADAIETMHVVRILLASDQTLFAFDRGDCHICCTGGHWKAPTKGQSLAYCRLLYRGSGLWKKVNWSIH